VIPLALPHLAALAGGVVVVAAQVQEPVDHVEPHLFSCGMSEFAGDAACRLRTQYDLTDEWLPI
jgi:hypothetical protein